MRRSTAKPACGVVILIAQDSPLVCRGSTLAAMLAAFPACHSAFSPFTLKEVSSCEPRNTRTNGRCCCTVELSAPAGWYWSASSVNEWRAWGQLLSDGYQGGNGKGHRSSVRCVR